MSGENLEYVGFWARTGAAFIDALLQLAVCLPLTYLVYGRTSAPGRFVQGFADVVISYLLPAVVIILFWVYKSATPGKMALSARVVDADTGQPLTTSRAVLRYLGYFVSLIPFGAGYFWVAFDRKKQGWHDKIANSVVVRPLGDETVQFARQKDWKGDPVEPRF